MSESFYFDGDPATESARRHLERVLSEAEPRRQRRWTAFAAALAGAAAWYFWPRRAQARDQGQSSKDIVGPLR